MAGRKYKQLRLQPYGHWLWVFSDWEAYKKAIEKKTGKPFPEKEKPLGRTQLLSLDASRLFMVYAQDEATLTHELVHVLMMTFDEIKSDPREGNSEPVSYMMSYLWEGLMGSRKFKV